MEHYLRMADSRFEKTWLEISTVLLAAKESVQSTVQSTVQSQVLAVHVSGILVKKGLKK